MVPCSHRVGGRPPGGDPLADPGSERRTEREGEAFDRAVDRHLAIFYRDSTLWPVLVVVVGAVGTLGASMLVLAVRERNPYSLVALAVLGWVSVDVVWRDLRERRFGVASRAIVFLWCVAAAVALVAARMKLF